MTQWNLDGAADAVLPARDAERSASNFERERALPAHTAEAPIGVFDSGAGGLTILATLRQELPYESYIYIGDTAHVPYGQRSDGEIAQLSIAAVRFLVEQGVKLVVVACNTASQAALNTLRATFNIPIVGVVPAVKPAARATRKGRVGVAATNQAAKAAYLQHLIDEFAEGIQVYAIGCPELVALVEAGIFDGPEAEQTVRQALQPLLAADVDVIVLGCTHFPAMRPLIERVAGKHIQIIDSGAAIARRTRSVLDTEGLMHPAGESGRVDIWCSGDPIAFTRVASELLGYAVVARQTPVIPAP
jgi:glutamate racemase